MELLVVIGIIAVLLAILLPVIARAREQAAAVACRSNLRQCGVFLIMYAHTNQGYIVPQYPSQRGDSVPPYRWMTRSSRSGTVT